jgi:hypothetical protein
MANIIIFADTTADDTLFLPYHPHLGRSRPRKSLGPYRIATEVRKSGFTCQVIQLFTSFTSEELEQVCKKFIDHDTISVSFSTVYWLTSRFPSIGTIVSSIINETKKINSNTKIIFGGPNSIILLDHVKNVDAVFLGYSEKQFTDYMISVRDKTSVPAYTRKENNTLVYDVTSSDQTFDFCRSQVIYQPEDCIDYGEPTIIEVGRGCIFKCKFCAYPMTGKKKLDFIKHYDVLTEELIYNYEHYGIYKYLLSDDTFNDSTEKIKELHKVFTSLPFKIYFSCYLRLDLLHAHREQINLLKEMGLRSCHFGVESFHDRAASSIGKGLSGDKAKKFLEELKNELWKDEVKIGISLIIGLPHETYESCQETNQWILDSNNLVDKVTIQELVLVNPTSDRSPYKSEFQINSAKYGYYWSNSKDSWSWKNLSSPISNRESAVEIASQLTKSSLLASREKLGGFDLFSMDCLVKYFEDSYSIEEQFKMDRYEYTNWINKNYNNATVKYIRNYINSILNL